MIKSYLKINLSLRVLKKQRNNLHNIQSNVFLLNYFDEIKIKKIKSTKNIIKFKGSFCKMVSKKNNTVAKTLHVLKSNNFLKSCYKIIINKKIPVFAGLGGGTGNAAALIKYFIKDVDTKTIKIFEKKIGSDLRLFFNIQSYQISLTKLIKYKKNYKFHILLIYPNLKCSTKTIYSKVKKFSKPIKVNYSRVTSNNYFLKLLKDDQNDLESIAVKKYPAINKLIEIINLQKGCLLARMSGSGSACFGIFNNIKSARSAQYKIKRKHPKYWSAVTKTI